MVAISFDTHLFVKTLQEAQFEQQQAGESVAKQDLLGDDR